MTALAVQRRLRALRQAQGLSQAALAERAQLSKHFVSALERGIKGCSLDTVLRYVEALGLTLTDLCQPEGRGLKGHAAMPTAQGELVPIGKRLKAARLAAA